MDYVSPREGVRDVPATAPPHAAVRRGKAGSLLHAHKKKLLYIAVAGLLVGTGTGVLGWKLLISKPADVNPFTAKIMASVQFPLYYPTQIPSGYHIDSGTVNEPQSGVVVFDMVGPKGQKLYMSEEARPTTFDLGGFYKKFEGLKEIPVSDGAVAVGKLGGGTTEIVSRANNKTWILSNTSASIPLDQLVSMMKSLTNSY